ncbi:alpha/beta fold hydrolase [Sphingomonas alba]|uniref:Alpha/beta hydrolase n=1 Tax=Sphingomonas alba TaxID=2908208 RepID=A0ABT0RII5_9SPHN|nr:alpha/beta fold hydrolase [Sphingomonas alba]MCL6682443.1 alpha/beta hydrolase [Sphingomonas alba]
MTDVTFFTSSDGIQLAWREVGQGRPIILLHGLFSDSNVNWVKFGTAERIAREGYRVIAPDLRAHGQSGKPHEAVHYPQLILVRDLRELIEHLGLDDFDLGGFSLGARTTIEAVLSGLKPKRAILAGTGLDVFTNWEKRSHFYVHAIDLFGKVQRGDPHWLAIQFMKTMNIDREAAKLLLGTMRDRESKAALAEAFSMPTLVVCGDKDDDNGSAIELANALPNADYAEIPGTHMNSVTRPELGEAIARFLGKGGR